ncbi:oligosaccharide flippase family protein [bacterium 3DAC]|jgi:putative peptidoglycan lipid II flippase|nr:oligosaccharide flippase family protein [Dictyoglomota bacterium]UZN23264.1 oligosaccharide flippase family protein [bacterium 3DAC]
MKGNIRKASIYTIIGKFLSKILGLIRERITKTMFGLSPEMSIFSFVITLIGLIRSTTIKSINKVSVPHILKHQEDEASISSSFSVVILFNILIGIILMIFSYPLAKYTLGNLTYSPSLIRFGQIMYIMAGTIIIILSISDTAESILSGFRIFTYQIIREPLINTIYIASILIFPSTTMLMGGRLIGELVFAVIIAVALLINKYFIWTKPHISHIKTIIWLSIPVVLGTSINFINTFVDRYMATLLPDTRSVSALAAATTIAILPYALFGEAIAKSVYTGFSEASTNKDMSEFSSYIGKVLYLGGWLIIPSAIGIASLSDNITFFLYYGGKFQMNDVTLVSLATMFYAFRYLFTSLYIPLNNSLVALEKGYISMWLALIFVPINIILNWLLGFQFHMGAPGFALATAITSGLMLISVIIILLHITQSRLARKHTYGLLKVTIASTIMALSLLFLKRLTGMSRIYTILLTVIGAMIYIVILGMLKDEELYHIIRKLARRKTQ